MRLDVWGNDFSVRGVGPMGQDVDEKGSVDGEDELEMDAVEIDSGIDEGVEHGAQRVGWWNDGDEVNVYINNTVNRDHKS